MEFGHVVSIPERLLRLTHKNRRAVTAATYALVSAAAYALAFQVRFEFSTPREFADVFKATLAIVLALRITALIAFGLSTSRWRYAGTGDVLRLALANASGTVVLLLVSRSFGWIPVIPYSIILLEWFLSTFFIASIWIVYRTIVEQLRFARSPQNGTPQRVIIVGAGDAGSVLAREMLRVPTGYRPLGFVDDDVTKTGAMLNGLPVLGTTDRLPQISKRLEADEAAIAIPSASPDQLRRILKICESTDLRFKVLPSITSVIAGKIGLSQLRDLQIDDLLGRPPIRLELPELYNDLQGRCVLITGAAGSIGSELARQVAIHAPGMLVLLDQAETPLFYLSRELRDAHPECAIVPIVGDIVDAAVVARVFSNYAPSRVYHAAAYKHVGMMQHQVREALRNNVLGTWRVADAAGRYDSDKFVLVSTDKAVRPSSVMGATKRLAEMVVQAMHERYSDTDFSAVRFGNVLGSSGSVIPIFQKQIEERKPVTISHPEATRYFMTIPEAVQLILQASLLPEMRGSIAMLEMGSPVRIMDLARTLLRLAGLPFVLDYTYTISGLGAGEKLHEELWDPEEASERTAIEKVRIVKPTDLSIDNLEELLASCEEDFQDGNDQAAFASLANLFPTLQFQAPEFQVTGVASSLKLREAMRPAARRTQQQVSNS
jgi:FlaA1/EpsC-like NDP-sugar epimerase